MKRVLLLLALGGAVFLAASPTQAANGMLTLGWDDACAPVANKDWDGSLPFTADLVLGVTGSDAANMGFRVRVVIGPDVKDAWRFDAGGCQLQNWLTNFAGTKACLPFKGANVLTLTEYSFDFGTNTAKLDIGIFYDKFTPDPLLSYTGWKASFDHAFSVLGAGDPNLVCQFAGDALCFAIRADHEIVLPQGNIEPFDAIAMGFVTWQDAGGTKTGCPAPVQIAPST